MLRAFIKKYRKKNSVILLLTFIMALIQTTSAVMHTFATDALINGSFLNFMLWNSVSLAMWGVLFILNYYSSAYEEKVVQLISTDIRQFIVEKIEVSPYQHVMKNSEGTYASWLNHDIKQIQDKGIRQYYAFWGYLFSVGLSVIALIAYHYSLVLLTFLLMGILLKFPALFERKMNHATDNLSKANENFLSKIYDTLAGYSVWNSMNHLQYMKKRVVQASQDLATENVRYVQSMKIAEGSIGIVNVFAQVAIVTFTGVLAYLNVVTIGALSSTGSLASAIFNAIAQGSQSRMLLKSVDVFFDKYHQFEANNQPLVTENIEMQKTLELRNIHYEINGKEIFQGFSYTFEKGKKYAIVGESGSGKTMLLNILFGNITDYQGELTIDGGQVVTAQQLKGMLAYIPQNSYIFNDTVMQNIAVWNEIDNTHISEVHHRLKIGEYAQLEDMIQESGKNLSGGQKQRIAFARALVKGANIYLLDESTANLDKETALYLENLLLDDPEATVIMVTHHLFEENQDKFDAMIHLGNHQVV